MSDTIDIQTDPVTAFHEFIEADDFPCVGAKAALARECITFFVAGDITHSQDDLPAFRELREFGNQIAPDDPRVRSFVLIFEGPDKLSERAFEDALWDRLQCFHNMDAAAGNDWRDDVASDPDDAHFSMSIANHPFFVVGLHPNASRQARRFAYPALVFNSHLQFDHLREDGRFDKMKDIIRKRDAELDGKINPMLSDFGEASEALQYSGRRLTADWKCPFQKMEPLDQ